jgi:hypothetical protein
MLLTLDVARVLSTVAHYRKALVLLDTRLPLDRRLFERDQYRVEMPNLDSSKDLRCTVRRRNNRPLPPFRRQR